MKLLQNSYLIFTLLFLSSCVSVKKFNELSTDYDTSKEQQATLQMKYQEEQTINKELNSNVIRLSERAASLEVDTAALGQDFRKKARAYSDLNSSYEMLIKNNSATMAKQAKENRKLMERLGQMEIDLQERERAIVNREEYVLELEGLLNAKDSLLANLKTNVAQALLGFKGKGLSVEQREGKLYVSLENSLLFSSGSWTVNAEGEIAIIELAKVLANQKDVQILVEGHTDDIPYLGSGTVKDNWDLSVLRATAIVRVLSNNKGVVPSQITAAGRGAFQPLVANDSKEHRAINRRTEIILTPNLDELFKLLE